MCIWHAAAKLILQIVPWHEEEEEEVEEEEEEEEDRHFVHSIEMSRMVGGNSAHSHSQPSVRMYQDVGTWLCPVLAVCWVIH